MEASSPQEEEEEDDDDDDGDGDGKSKIQVSCVQVVKDKKRKRQCPVKRGENEKDSSSARKYSELGFTTFFMLDRLKCFEAYFLSRRVETRGTLMTYMTRYVMI